MKKLLLAMLSLSISLQAMMIGRDPNQQIVIPTPKPLPQPAHPAQIPVASHSRPFSSLPADVKRLLLLYLADTGDSLRDALRTMTYYQMVDKTCLNLWQHLGKQSQEETLCAITARLAQKWRGNNFTEVTYYWKNKTKPYDDEEMQTHLTAHFGRPVAPSNTLLRTPALIAHCLEKLEEEYKELQTIFKKKEHPEKALYYLQKGFLPTQLIQQALHTTSQGDATPEQRAQAQEKYHKALTFLLQVGIPQEVITQEQRYLAFRQAILDQNHDAIETFLKLGFDVQRPILNTTPLMLATCARAGTVITKLCQAGASVNQTAFNNETPLIIAADSSFHEIAELLIQLGAQVNHCNRYGETPLIRTAWFEMPPPPDNDLDEADNDLDEADIERHETQQYASHTRTIEVLLKAGAAVNIQERNDGNTALIIATMNELEGMVAQLLKAGANPSIRNKAGEKAIDIAKKQKNQYLIELLTEAEKQVAEHIESTLTTRARMLTRQIAYYEDERSDNESDNAVSDTDSVIAHSTADTSSPALSQNSSVSTHDSHSGHDDENSAVFSEAEEVNEDDEESVASIPSVSLTESDTEELETEEASSESDESYTEQQRKRPTKRARR